ncbi:hypothetical protein, partial [Aneurinibacillus aneurinilyticus]|uniref:hypothetical protein n=1 Tax=Aneurinibacillus aneurinilyticus TaxID=1391 RepID=UPI0023F92C3C
DAYGVRPLCFLQQSCIRATRTVACGTSQVFFTVWSVWRQGRNGPATVSRIEKPRCFAGPALAPQSGRVSSL